MKTKILVLGVTGMLGYTLFNYLSSNENLEIRGTLRNLNIVDHFFPKSTLIFEEQINAENLNNVENIFIKMEPNIVINCIGKIKQKKDTIDTLSYIKINALFPHQLAEICRKYQAKLIQISTDCVFSGNRGNYKEEENPDPIDLYGRTKLLGEISERNCLTIRTSIIGYEINSCFSLLEWFISQKGKIIKGYNRAIYTGFTTLELSRIIEQIIFQYPMLEGLWHVSSNPITKYQLLNIINQSFDLEIIIEKDEDFICDRSLNSEKFRLYTGYIPPTWEEMITELATLK